MLTELKLLPWIFPLISPPGVSLDEHELEITGVPAGPRGGFAVGSDRFGEGARGEPAQGLVVEMTMALHRRSLADSTQESRNGLHSSRFLGEDR